MPKGDVFSKVITIVTVPMLIIIGLIIFGNFATVTNQTFEEDYTNETFSANGGDSIVADHPPVVNDTYNLYNDSAHSTELTEGSDYYLVDLENGTFSLDSGLTTGGNVYLEYTGHGGEGWTQAQDVKNTSYSGFNLASVLPIVIAGVAVLGIVIGAFAYMRG